MDEDRSKKIPAFKVPESFYRRIDESAERASMPLASQVVWLLDLGLRVMDRMELIRRPEVPRESKVIRVCFVSRKRLDR